MLCRHSLLAITQPRSCHGIGAAHIFQQRKDIREIVKQFKASKKEEEMISQAPMFFTSVLSILVLLPMLVVSNPLQSCQTHGDCNGSAFSLCSLGVCRPCTGYAGGTYTSAGAGYCFYNTFSRRRHWQQSYDTCKNVGLQMVQIRTLEKQMEVERLASGRGHNPFWLDLRCQDTDEECRNFENWNFPDGRSARDVEYNGWELDPDGEIIFSVNGDKCATFVTSTDKWGVADCNIAGSNGYETVCEAVNLYEATPSTAPTITSGPSNRPSVRPSLHPSESHPPSSEPSQDPSSSPSQSVKPSQRPSVVPTDVPSLLPSLPPTASQSPTSPTTEPSFSIAPSDFPPSCDDHNVCPTDEVCLEGYCRSCGPGASAIKFTANNGKAYGYCWFNGESVTFDEAEQNCDDLNMMMIQLRSSEENNFFNSPEYMYHFFWIDITCHQTSLGPFCHQDPSKIVYPDGTSYNQSGINSFRIHTTGAETRLCGLKFYEIVYEWDYCHVDSLLSTLCEPRNLYELEPSRSPSTSMIPTLTMDPSSKPSKTPSIAPSYSTEPSQAPTRSNSPSEVPSSAPSFVPSQKPSTVPTGSIEPSTMPSTGPTVQPTMSQAPSGIPTKSLAPSPAPSLVVCADQGDCDSSTICRGGFCRSCGSDATAVHWQGSSGTVYHFCWFGERSDLWFDFYQGKQTCEDIGMQVPQIRTREKNDVLKENLGDLHYGFWMDLTCDGATYGNDACQKNMNLWKYPDGTSMTDSFYYMVQNADGTLVLGAPGKNCAHFLGSNRWSVAYCSNNRFYTKRLLCEPASLAADSAPPSKVASIQPSLLPSVEPSTVPSFSPSFSPSSTPTNLYSGEPSHSVLPSHSPSDQPSSNPSSRPSKAPSSIPSAAPSSKPTEVHSDEPSSSASPSTPPTSQPSFVPSSRPSSSPSSFPSAFPTALPSSSPTETPSSSPSSVPTSHPTQKPSIGPTVSMPPSHTPSFRPTASPSLGPSTSPTSLPSSSPTGMWNEIFSEGFESGTFGVFTDGGSDASLHTKKVHTGGYSLKLRDDSSSSVATTGAYDLGDITTVQVEFYFRFGGMENGEEFYLQYSEGGDGSGWNSAGTWTKGSTSMLSMRGSTKLNNNNWYFDQVSIDTTGMSSIQLRFVCNSSSNKDKVFIDDIIFKGRS